MKNNNVKTKKTVKILLWVSVPILILVIGYFMMFINIPYNWIPSSLHQRSIEKRAEKKYLKGEYSDSTFTSFKVYPLYDENDEISHYLVELAPNGYTYVTLRKGGFINSVYAADLKNRETTAWQRYQYEDDYVPMDDTILWRKDEYNDVLLECDENGNDVLNERSPYAVAGVLEERLYFINGSIPAVKRGEKYLNLISLELFELAENIKMPNQRPQVVPKANF